MRKRIVFEHLTGPMKGIYQIFGTNDEFENGQPPEFAERVDIELTGETKNANLVRVYPRFFLFRESQGANTPHE